MRKFWFFALIAVAGCCTNPCYESALVDQAKTTLIHQLNRRDTEMLDLAWLGQLLSREYGEFQAQRAVSEVWFVLTGGQPTEKAGDVIWLQDQPPRVQDVAWLVHWDLGRAEWP